MGAGRGRAGIQRARSRGAGTSPPGRPRSSRIGQHGRRAPKRGKETHPGCAGVAIENSLAMAAADPTTRPASTALHFE